MANIKWSWMFGPETSNQLVNEMGWARNQTSNNGPADDFNYTYTGDPQMAADIRRSYILYSNYHVTTPAQTAAISGSISVPVYFNGTPQTNSDDLIFVMNSSLGTAFEIESMAGGGFQLRVAGVIKETITGFPSADNWTYLTLKYDMSTTPYSAQMWINGSGSGTTYTQASTPQTIDGSVRIQGLNSSAGQFAAYFGQIATYSDWVDTETPKYVTRVNPTVDINLGGGEVTTGTWTPSVGTDNFAVLSGTFDSSTFTSNTGSATGDKVVCQVTGALGLITQLGTTPSVIDGITVHAWASGSGQNGFAGLGDSQLGSWDSGTEITPDIDDPTYCFSSAPDQPSNGAVWNATSSLYIKYEVS